MHLGECKSVRQAINLNSFADSAGFSQRESSAGFDTDLRIGVKKHMLDNWAYRHFTDFLITFALIKAQVMRVAGIEHNAFRVRIFGAPVMQRFEQLLTQMLALKLGVYAD